MTILGQGRRIIAGQDTFSARRIPEQNAAAKLDVEARRGGVAMDEAQKIVQNRLCGCIKEDRTIIDFSKNTVYDLHPVSVMP